MKRVVIIGLLLLLLPMATATNHTETDRALFSGDLEALTLGDEARVTATLVNRLPASDTLRLTLSGSATAGLIDAEIDSSQSGVHTCSVSGLECLVDIESESQRDINITVEATAMGQGVLRGTANSTLTDQAGTDTLDVSVEPTYGQRLVSAPGIMPLHLLVIALAASLVLVLRRQ
jgi:hypothetical protein